MLVDSQQLGEITEYQNKEIKNIKNNLIELVKDMCFKSPTIYNQEEIKDNINTNHKDNTDNTPESESDSESDDDDSEDVSGTPPPRPPSPAPTMRCGERMSSPLPPAGHAVDGSAGGRSPPSTAHATGRRLC